jgi:hypothetical protein
MNLMYQPEVYYLIYIVILLMCIKILVSINLTFVFDSIFLELAVRCLWYRQNHLLCLLVIDFFILISIILLMLAYVNLTSNLNYLNVLMIFVISIELNHSIWQLYLLKHLRRLFYFFNQILHLQNYIDLLSTCLSSCHQMSILYNGKYQLIQMYLD